MIGWQKHLWPWKPPQKPMPALWVKTYPGDWAAINFGAPWAFALKTVQVLFIARPGGAHAMVWVPGRTLNPSRN